jgi:hypothetical protein
LSASNEVRHLEANLEAWETHDWSDRPLAIDPGEKIIHFICRKCGRGFANDATGRRYAIHASAFAVYRLSDEVTDRRLSEPCPPERQQVDLDHRRTRHTAFTAKSK